jgi:hypothetical protein
LSNLAPSLPLLQARRIDRSTSDSFIAASEASIINIDTEATLTNHPTAKIVYLACPYTHPSSQLRERRFLAATNAAARLINQGHVVFSPITMTHPIDLVLAGKDSTLGTDFWVRFDEAFMGVCSEMAILRIEGWQESAGILREREFFEKRGRPIWFLDP